MNNADLILKAYENEVFLDKYLSDKFLGGYDPAFLNYLTFKPYSLIKFSRYGKVSFFVLFFMSKTLFLAYISLMPLLMLFSVVFLPFLSRKKMNKEVFIYSTPSEHIFKTLDCYDVATKVHPRKFFNLLSFLTLRDLFKAVFLSLAVIVKALITKKCIFVKKTNSMHFYDLPNICLLTVLLDKLNYSDHYVITDSNLQRWDYLQSHLVLKNGVVQHGFIYSDINFPHRFGTVDQLFLFSNQFEPVFSSYFDCKSISLIKTSMSLSKYDEVSDDKKICLLASSQPYVEYEVAYINEKIDRDKYHVIIKLHPKHVYNEKEFKKLEDAADKMVTDAFFPECDLMLSYDSFLGYEYSSLGIPVIFIKGE